MMNGNPNRNGKQIWIKTRVHSGTNLILKAIQNKHNLPDRGAAIDYLVKQCIKDANNLQELFEDIIY